jgi:hypothetical protein
MPEYEALVEDGWTALAQGDYSSATERFEGAVSLRPELADAYTGLGWSQALAGDLVAAGTAFETGAGRSGSTAVLADLYAGWAFTLNASADLTASGTAKFDESNARAGAALALDPAWSLEFLPQLDVADLRVLLAENHYMLGGFEASLAMVQLLDPGFSADVGTPEGQAELAARIEALVAGGMGRPARQSRGV